MFLFKYENNHVLQNYMFDQGWRYEDFCCIFLPNIKEDQKQVLIFHRLYI